MRSIGAIGVSSSPQQRSRPMMCAPAPPLIQTGGRDAPGVRRLIPLRRICRRPMQQDSRPIHRGALRARRPWRRARRRDFRSICSPKVFRRPGSFHGAERRHFRRRKTRGRACARLSRRWDGPSAGQRERECSPAVCRACFGIAFYPLGADPAPGLCRDARARCKRFP